MSVMVLLWIALLFGIAGLVLIVAAGKSREPAATVFLFGFLLAGIAVILVMVSVAIKLMT